MYVLKNFHMPQGLFQGTMKLIAKWHFMTKMDRKIPEIYQDCRTTSETENNLE